MLALQRVSNVYILLKLIQHNYYNDYMDNVHAHVASWNSDKQQYQACWFPGDFFWPLYISHHKTKTWQETRYEYVHIWCTLLFVSPYVEWSFSRRFHRARLFSVVVSVITRLSWKKWKKTKRISRNGQVRMSRIGSVKNMGKMWLRNLKVSKLTCRVKLESIVFSCRWQLRIRDLAVTPK